MNKKLTPKLTPRSLTDPAAEQLIESVNDKNREMKSPLTTVVGLTEVLISEMENGRGVVREKDLTTIHNAAKRMIEMIEEISVEIEKYQNKKGNSSS